MKICCKCNLTKDDSEYYFREGKPSGRCKDCTRLVYEENKKDILAKQKNRRIEDDAFKLKANNYASTYRKNNPEYFKKYLSEYGPSYYQENRERLIKKNLEYKKRRIASDPEYALKRKIRKILGKHFNRLGATKLKSSKDYGINFAEIFASIGGRPSELHVIDHIIPLALFNFNNLLHVKLSHDPNNLRWISKQDNDKKSDYIYYDLIAANEKLLEIANVIGITEEMDGLRSKDVMLLLGNQ